MQVDRDPTRAHEEEQLQQREEEPGGRGTAAVPLDIPSSSPLASSSSTPPSDDDYDDNDDEHHHPDDDRIPDDVMLLVFAALASDFVAAAVPPAPTPTSRAPSSSAAASSSSSSSSFVWFRTTLPLVSQRWRGLLSGPSPVWRHVVIDTGAEVVAAAAAARARAGGGGALSGGGGSFVSGSARRLWGAAAAAPGASSRGASPTPAALEDPQQQQQQPPLLYATAPLSIPPAGAAAAHSQPDPPLMLLPPASPSAGPIAFAVAPGVSGPFVAGASPPAHHRPLARLSRTSRPLPFAASRASPGSGLAAQAAAAAAAGAAASSSSAAHHRSSFAGTAANPRDYCVRADAVLRWLQPRSPAVHTAALVLPPAAAHDFDARRWAALAHLLRRPLRSLSVLGAASARQPFAVPPAAAPASHALDLVGAGGGGGGSPRAATAATAAAPASSPPAAGFHYFPASPPPPSLGAAAATATGSRDHGLPPAPTGPSSSAAAAAAAAAAAGERWRAAAAAAAAALAALGTGGGGSSHSGLNPGDGSDEGEAHSGLFDALGSLRALEALELEAAPQGPALGAALPALAFLPRLASLAVSLDLAPAAPAPAPELPSGLTSLRLGNMWLESLFQAPEDDDAGGNNPQQRRRGARPPALLLRRRPSRGSGGRGGLGPSSSASSLPAAAADGPWSNLRELTLERCAVDADPMPRVCALPRLERLRVRGGGGGGNGRAGGGGGALAHPLAPLMSPPPRLAPSATLVELALEDMGLSALGADIAGLTALRRLSLRNNGELGGGVGGGGGGTAAAAGATGADAPSLGFSGGLPDALALLPALEFLDLSHCGLGQLPRVVPLLGALTELLLRGNQLSSLRGGGGGGGGGAAAARPFSVQAPAFAGTLRVLDLSCNARLREVPPLALACAGLERLCLSSSALAGGLAVPSAPAAAAPPAPPAPPQPLRLLPRLLPRLRLLRVDGDAYERRAVGQLLGLQRELLLQQSDAGGGGGGAATTASAPARPRLVVEMVSTAD
jgi:hypothetical protein